MLTMDMLLWDIRDRIIYQRLQNKVLPAHQAALLFDRKEMLRGNRFYIGHWRDLPPTAPLGCVTSVFFCVMEEGMVLAEEPDVRDFFVQFYRDYIDWPQIDCYLHILVYHFQGRPMRVC